MVFPLVDQGDIDSRQKLAYEIQVQDLENLVTDSEQMIYQINPYELIATSDFYLNSLNRQVNSLCVKYKFKEEVRNFIEAIILEAIKYDKFNLSITETGDEQIVLYTENEGDFTNLAIDEDGDVSYMFFAKEKEKSKRKLYCYDDKLDIKELALLF